MNICIRGRSWPGICFHSSVYAQSPSRVRLCDPIDYSLPGSSVYTILQARILEWVPFPSPGDLPDPGIEPGSPVLQADALPSEPPGNLVTGGLGLKPSDPDEHRHIS